MGKLTKECYVEGLKMIFKKNWGVEVDLFNWSDEIDFKISYAENFNILFNKLERRRLL